MIATCATVFWLGLSALQPAWAAPDEPESGLGTDTPTASPPPAPPPVEPPAFDDSHRGRLERASLAYQRGNRDEARKLLSELLLDPTLEDVATHQEARVSMAELLLATGDTESAQRFLEQVLREDPDYALDPFRYPPEVIDQFGYVRALIGPELEDRPPAQVAVVAPTPLNVWSPFAPYHFQHGRKLRGVIYSAGWVTTWAAATMMHALFLADRTYKLEDPAEKRALVQLRATQWSLTGANVAVYVTSVVDAQIHWRRKGAAASLQQSAQARVRMHPTGFALQF